MFLIVPKLILMIWFGPVLDMFEQGKYDSGSTKEESK